MSLDAFKNFARATVSSGYDGSATSIDLTSGHGARFPTVPFNAVWWNATDYANPADDPNVEIIRVTGRSTDTLTVTRGQEGTSASTKNASGKTYRISQPLTKKTLDDIATDIAAAQAAAIAAAATDATTKAAAAQAASQPLHANLTAESGLTGAADRVSYYTNAGTKALATLTAFGRSLIACVDLAALKTILALVKGDVGLGNVDNTSDANKPVSTATQTALDLKAPLASPALTGTPTAPTAAADTNTTQIATTAFAKGEADAAQSAAAADATSKADAAQAAAIAASEPAQTAASQAEAEAGSSTSLRSWTPQRIGQAIYALVAAAIHSKTGKTTPVDADEVGLVDSAASYALKVLTWANLKATLKTYFDTLYATSAQTRLTAAAQVISASAIDWATGVAFSKTLAANTTFTFSNDTDGWTITVFLTNTAGNYTVTWPTVVWFGGTPTMTVGAKTDAYTFKKIGNTIYGSYLQNAS